MLNGAGTSRNVRSAVASQSFQALDNAAVNDRKDKDTEACLFIEDDMAVVLMSTHLLPERRRQTPHPRIVGQKLKAGVQIIAVMFSLTDAENFQALDKDIQQIPVSLLRQPELRHDRPSAARRWISLRPGSPRCCGYSRRCRGRQPEDRAVHRPKALPRAEPAWK